MTERLLTADTSVVVPAVAAWHEAHVRARESLRHVTRLPGHVLVESVSVLTRLPRGLALSVPEAVGLVRSCSPEAPMLLGPGQIEEFLDTLGTAGIGGGRVYDALVAETARAAGATLLSLDERARATYRAIGVNADTP